MGKFPPPKHPIYLATKKANPVTLQNVLLTTPDLDLSIVFSDVPEDQVQEILAHGSPVKAQQIVQELERLKRVKVFGKDMVKFQEIFLQRIQGKTLEQPKRYLKPRED